MEKTVIKADDELIIEFSPEVGENIGFYDTIPNLFSEHYINKLLSKYQPDASRMTLTGNIKSMVYFIGALLEEYEAALQQIHVTNELHLTDFKKNEDIGKFESD